MIILEAAVHGSIELHCVIQRSVSVLLPSLVGINGVDKIIETPVSVTRYSSLATETTFPKMSIRLNQHLSYILITVMKGGFIVGMLY